jgi:ABC-2 type transport system ATP-binding protein
MSGQAMDVQGLTKYYGDLLAVDHISFAVGRGEIFGFLGPNGAGKTTIRMLTGLSKPTSGDVRMLGLDLARELPKIKKRIGVVPERSNLYNELSARDNLIFSMQLYGVPRQEWTPRAEALLERFRLADKRDAPFARLSRGMKRALTIAAALAHRPAIVFLDEPTTGLDVVSARNLRQMVAGLRDAGVTLFLTTHYLEEAERLCDRVAILVDGKIVALDTVEGLKAQLQDTAAVELVLSDGAGESETHRVVDESVERAVRRALTQAAGRSIVSLNTIQPTLEDVFVHLTGLTAEVMQLEKGGKGA